MAPRGTITALASDFGAIYPLEVDESIGLDKTTHAIFKATGVKQYCVSDDLVENIRSSVMKSVTKSGLAPNNFDMILTAADSAVVPDMDTVLREVFLDLDFKSSTVLGVRHVGCANAVLAMLLADMMISNGMLQNCLVVAYHKGLPGEGRILRPTVGFESDGVATCVVTANNVQGYRLEHPVLRSRPILDRRSTVDDLVDVAKIIGESLNVMSTEFFEKSRNKHDDFEVIFMNNMSFSTIRMFATQFGVEWSKVYKDRVPIVSHAGGVDIIANIAAFEEDVSLVLEKKGLILANSPSDWLAAELHVVSGV